LDADYKKTEIWNFNNNDVNVPLWDIHHTTALWGATSMILMELVFLYNEYARQTAEQEILSGK
jgi:hypothetical protein